MYVNTVFIDESNTHAGNQIKIKLKSFWNICICQFLTSVFLTYVGGHRVWFRLFR